MTAKDAIEAMRREIKTCRERHFDEFDHGRMTGIRVCLMLLEGTPGVEGLIDPTPTGCPDCLAPLPNPSTHNVRSGHCDACGWVKQSVEEGLLI